jgi:hypothetical protein
MLLVKVSVTGRGIFDARSEEVQAGKGVNARLDKAENKSARLERAGDAEGEVRAGDHGFRCELDGADGTIKRKAELLEQKEEESERRENARVKKTGELEAKQKEIAAKNRV